MEQKKRSVRLLILGVVVGMALVIAGLSWWLMTPKGIYQGFYSVINENKAKISSDCFVRDVYVEEDGSGRLSVFDAAGASPDVITFSSYEIRADKILFRGIKFNRQQGADSLLQEQEGEYVLSLSFSLKEEGFVLDSCHYQRIKQ